MLSGLGYVLWYFAPAMLFNLLVYFHGRWFGQACILPFDLRAEIGGQRIMGDGRGYTGFAWMLVSAAFCSLLQGRGPETLILAAGAQFGTLMLSLIKRRLGLPRGAAWRPWEHLDFIAGAILFQALSGDMTLPLALSGLALCGIVHWLIGGAIKSVLGPR